MYAFHDVSAEPEYDVVIVGAGPAGLSCASILSRLNIRRVLIIDRELHNRIKPCGGGLTVRACKILHIVFPEFQNIVRARVRRVFIIRKRNVYILEDRRRSHIMLTVKREEFDKEFLNYIVENTHFEITKDNVLGIEYYNNFVKVVCRDREVTARFVVGADGVYSIVSRHVGNSIPIDRLPFAARAYCDRWDFDDSAVLDFSKILSLGYFWIFPLSDGYANVGYGEFSLRSKKTNIINELKSYISFVGLRVRGDIRGHALPLKIQDNITSKDGKVLLVGDAAGLVDYTIGEGITYACLSGAIAGLCILKGRLKPESVRELYRSIMSYIVSDLKICRDIAIAVPYFIDNIMDIVLRRTFTSGARGLSILEGKYTYKDAIRKMLDIKLVVRELRSVKLLEARELEKLINQLNMC